MSGQLGSRVLEVEFLDTNPKAPAGPRFVTNNRVGGPESVRVVGNGFDTRLSSKLATAVEEKLAKARQADFELYGSLVRKSVDGKLTAKETDQLADVCIRLGLRPEQIDADAKDYLEHKQLSGTDWKAEADAAQRDCFEATAQLRQIEQVELPRLRKESANKKARVSFCSASRQRLEIIEKSKPWLIATPAPAEK